MGILVDPTKYFPSHPSEEILEAYVLQRLPEGLTAPLEEHLLVCHRCQDLLAETDEIVAALKLVSNQPVPQPATWAIDLPGLAHRIESDLSPLAPAPAREPLRLNLDLKDLVSTGE